MPKTQKNNHIVETENREWIDFTAKNTSRSWQNIPHVTHIDEADITQLEEFRKNKNEKRSGSKEVVFPPGPQRSVYQI